MARVQSTEPGAHSLMSVGLEPKAESLVKAVCWRAVAPGGCPHAAMVAPLPLSFGGTLPLGRRWREGVAFL